jgi:hypothetical protein
MGRGGAGAATSRGWRCRGADASRSGCEPPACQGRAVRGLTHNGVRHRKEGCGGCFWGRGESRQRVRSCATPSRRAGRWARGLDGYATGQPARAAARHACGVWRARGVAFGVGDGRGHTRRRSAGRRLRVVAAPPSATFGFRKSVTVPLLERSLRSPSHRAESRTRARRDRSCAPHHKTGSCPTLAACASS